MRGGVAIKLVAVGEARDITGTVLLVQELERQGAVKEARRYAQEVVQRCKPLLRSRARQLAAGSVTFEDLMQIGALEVWRSIAKFSVTAARGQPFEYWARARAYVRMRNHVVLHAYDVHMSDGARRGRTKSAGTVGVEWIESQDAPHPYDNDLRPRSSFWADYWDGQIRRGDAAPSPEEMLEAAQMEALVRRYVNRLPAPLRDLVAWVHGIGRPRASLREIARQWNTPRARLDTDLKRGERMLRRLIERELRVGAEQHAGHRS